MPWNQLFNIREDKTLREKTFTIETKSIKKNKKLYRKLIEKLPNKNFMKRLTSFSLCFPEYWEEAYLASELKIAINLGNLEAGKRKRQMLYDTVGKEINKLLRTGFDLAVEKGVTLELNEEELVLYVESLEIDVDSYFSNANLERIFYDFLALKGVENPVLSSYYMFFFNIDSFSYNPARFGDTLDISGFRKEKTQKIRKEFLLGFLEALPNSPPVVKEYLDSVVKKPIDLTKFVDGVREFSDVCFPILCNLSKLLKNDSDKKFIVAVLLLNAFYSEENVKVVDANIPPSIVDSLAAVSSFFLFQRLNKKTKIKVLEELIEKLLPQPVREVIRGTVLGKVEIDNGVHLPIIKKSRKKRKMKVIL